LKAGVKEIPTKSKFVIEERSDAAIQKCLLNQYAGLLPTTAFGLVAKGNSARNDGHIELFSKRSLDAAKRNPGQCPSPAIREPRKPRMPKKSPSVMNSSTLRRAVVIF
jgi:hypothetical protein